jgi:hypothetical protein
VATAYSPEKRTALVFCGTGAHGAYHAGALRALQEAGVKVDIVAGQGIGAAAAALAAIDGGARLWEDGGLWRSQGVRQFYEWKWPLRAAGWLSLLLAGVLLIPLLFLAIGLVVYPLSFLLTMLGTSAGASLLAWYSTFLQTSFAGENLPTIGPRLAVIALGVLVLCVAGSVALAHWRAPVVRRARGNWWWRIAAAPLDVAPVRDAVASTVWQLIRGAAAEAPPAGLVFGRRYAEVVAENLGQPGFRELMLLATDLDTRQDIVATLLREPYRRDFMAPRSGRERRAEVLDLAGAGRDHALDVVTGGLTPPLGCDPHLITFPTDSFWRGETHRLCDRPGSVSRLLEELSVAGASQAIVISAVPAASGPHRLSSPRLDLRNRLGEMVAASQAAALRDALENARLRFDALYVISPDHNPVGPFDFGGAYDEASDRRHQLVEVMERAYEDAYHQFIEPVVGASGEQLAGRVTPTAVDESDVFDGGE